MPERLHVGDLFRRQGPSQTNSYLGRAKEGKALPPAKKYPAAKYPQDTMRMLIKAFEEAGFEIPDLPLNDPLRFGEILHDILCPSHAALKSFFGNIYIEAKDGETTADDQQHGQAARRAYDYAWKGKVLHTYARKAISGAARKPGANRWPPYYTLHASLAHLLFAVRLYLGGVTACVHTAVQ